MEESREQRIEKKIKIQTTERLPQKENNTELLVKIQMTIYKGSQKGAYYFFLRVFAIWSNTFYCRKSVNRCQVPQLLCDVTNYNNTVLDRAAENNRNTPSLLGSMNRNG